MSGDEMRKKTGGNRKEGQGEEIMKKMKGERRGEERRGEGRRGRAPCRC